MDLLVMVHVKQSFRIRNNRPARHCSSAYLLAHHIIKVREHVTKETYESEIPLSLFSI